MSDAPQSARERSYAEPERDACPYARCAKQPRDVYVAHRGGPEWLWCGDQRAPQRPDEKGAVAVIDLRFGGRIALYAIEGDPTHRRVERLA